MFERILVAYDGSEPATAAMDFAFDLAGRTNAHVVVAHVVAPPGDDQELEPDAALLSAFLGEGQERWSSRLAGVAARAPRGVEVEWDVRVGPVAATLLELVDEKRADLMVAGTHGVGGVKRVLLGSVTQRLLERAPCAVMFFRAPLPANAAPKVLVGLDGSPDAEVALSAAQGLAAVLGTALVLVHVADYHIPFADGGHLSALQAELRRHGEELLREARSRLAAPLERVIDHLREGSVREQILAACDEDAPVIAVVGSRGIHGFRGLLVGSVARDLINYGTAPVLVTRASA